MQKLLIKGFILSLSITLAFCSGSPDRNTPSTNVPEPPDSTAFYDSAFAPFRDSIDAFFNAKIQERRFNGAYLFAQHGRIIDTGYYGYADWKSKDTLSLNHAFQLASASKPFTALAVLQLSDEGLLDLDQDIRAYIPNFPYEGITARLLLQHRGGLGQYTSFMEPYWKDTLAGIYMTNDDIINRMAIDTPMYYHPPNKTYEYNNTGYAVLASLVECVSGQRFKDYMRKNIFDPYGMKDAFIIDKAGEIPDLIAQGHLWDYRLPGNDYINGVVGDKGMYATVWDLLAFDKALRNGEVLNADICTEMMSPQNPVKPNGRCYGYGWRLLYPNTDSAIVYHTGWWHGSRSWFIRYPKENKVAIVLDNVKRGPFFSTIGLIGLITDDY